MFFKEEILYSCSGLSFGHFSPVSYAIMEIIRNIFFFFFILLVGKKIVKLEISSGEKNMTGAKSAKRSLSSSVLEFQLDELRKELSSIQGGIFPHSVLSTQQISMINAQKPNSVEQASFIITSPICFE
jgi:hypothetical protein